MKYNPSRDFEHGKLFVKKYQDFLLVQARPGPDRHVGLDGLSQQGIRDPYDAHLDDPFDLRQGVLDLEGTDPIRARLDHVLDPIDEEDVAVRIGDLEKFRKLAYAGEGDNPLGLKVERVGAEIAKNIGLRKVTGVIVTNVARGSVAEEMGLTQGDIIFRVNNREVREAKMFSEMVRESEKDGSVLLLLRDSRSGRIGHLVVPLKVG